jgi:hypothetical protein
LSDNKNLHQQRDGEEDQEGDLIWYQNFYEFWFNINFILKKTILNNNSKLIDLYIEL